LLEAAPGDRFHTRHRNAWIRHIEGIGGIGHNAVEACGPVLATRRTLRCRGDDPALRRGDAQPTAGTPTTPWPLRPTTRRSGFASSETRIRVSAGAPSTNVTGTPAWWLSLCGTLPRIISANP
jgi:hypothetical protein